MTVYMDLVMLLNLGVDLLLLLASDRMAGYRTGLLRLCASAALGAVYAGACLLPGFYFLQNAFWRIVSLFVMSTIAFGLHHSALRRCVLFCFLSLALGGAALCFNCGSLLSVSLCAGLIILLCMYGTGGRAADQRFVQIDLIYMGKKRRLTALKDTGNTLIDPLTGQNVVVLGSDLAWDLLGLTEDQLSDPITTISTAQIPGLRLIPYCAVGITSGLLLAASMDDIRVGSQKVSNIVAFSPSQFRNKEGYQALLGGII